MSEFGIKITNFEAGSIYGVSLGIRNRYDTTGAMLVNSLFLDFLQQNGLEIKGESTRDIICLTFNYGSPSFKEEIAKHKAAIKKTESEETKKVHEQLIKQAEENEDKFNKKTRSELRIEYYVNGVDINYPIYTKRGKLKGFETYHYKMLYRTPGKAKKGTCMFICDRLYDVVHNFLYMGIEMPLHNSPIVEIGAYASLITSGIVGRIHIEPEQILIVKDVSTYMKTKVMKVCTDENLQCYAEEEDNYELESVLFDGQALIDYSIFPEWADGYILLRHHFTKCAAFNTNIELFMREQFGDEYETATVKDMFGRDVRVKDIKLITTNNAVKWLKFHVSFDYWAEWVRANDCTWGIVKTTHPSKFGNVQRTSYQMINSLDMDSMDSVVEYSRNYINKLKADDQEFLRYLEKNKNFANDYEVLVALCKHNKDFVKCEYFRRRKYWILKAYLLDFKGGRTLQNADNLTIVGSPYALLLHSIGKNALEDPTFSKEDGAIQCWTERFKDGEYLAEFRNPYNGKSNLGYLHNIYHPYFDKYFKLGKLCIAVNMIETDFQARNNGSDMDSDSIYTTNLPAIVSHAKRCYKEYLTIVNEIKPEKNVYDYSLENYALIDNSLQAAQMAIGQSSNLAQLALTYTYNFEDKKYFDYVCILSVLA